MLRATRREDFGVAIGLDDALLGWLASAAGTGLARRLRGNPTHAALRTIVKEAVTITVAEVAGDLDSDQVDHLRSSLLVRDIVPDRQQPAVSNEAELRRAVHTWT